MESVTWWAWLLAGSSIAMALAAAVLLLRLKQQDGPPPASSAPAEKPAPSPASPANSQREQQAKRVRNAAKALQQSWFVVFESPSEEADRQLSELLISYNAFYDAQLRVYYITSQHSTYQLTIAHSASPGTLPPLHQGERQPDGIPLAGVSVLIKFINKQSVARHPGTFIDVMLAAQRIGGSILNSEHQRLAPEDFTALFADLQQNSARSNAGDPS